MAFFRAGARASAALGAALRDAAELAPGLLRAAALLYGTQAYVGELHHSVGPSMLPTFNARGDICVSNKTVAARVLAVEGQTVRVDHGGAPAAAGRGALPDGACITVPGGHVWLQGDNLHNSTDSRYYGPVPRAMLKGVVFARAWPPSAAGWVESKQVHGHLVVDDVLRLVPSARRSGGRAGNLGTDPVQHLGGKREKRACARGGVVRARREDAAR
eukprot:PRCOL_00006693-RA